MENQSSRQQTGSSSGFETSTAPNPTCSAEFAAERARLMFGCYRKGDANDPDTYVAAVAMVLSRYSAEIVQAITDPFSGLPSRKTESGWSGLPDVADVKLACETEATRRERYKQLGSRKPVPRITGPKQNRANVFVPDTAPQYAPFVERAKTADPMDWRRDEAGRPGIWVPHQWMFDSASVGRTQFSTFTPEQLRAMYPPAEPKPAAGETEAA